jgi:carbonic anhydrase
MSVMANTNPITAWKALKEGNDSFVAGKPVHPSQSIEHRTALAVGQKPTAVLFGCADSRVAAEIIFDQGLGDLFVIRVAGNVVSPSQVGSVEFAAERFGTRLVVVMGHTHCGAVTATLEAVESGAHQSSGSVQFIVDRVRAAVESVREVAPREDRAALLRAAVRANVRVAAAHLRPGSPVLERLIDDDGLVVVGAEYDVESGVVEFFDHPLPGPPRP